MTRLDHDSDYRGTAAASRGGLHAMARPTARRWLAIQMVTGIVVGVIVSSFPRLATAELIPTPSFSNHEIPSIEVPSGDSSLWIWLHVGLLLIALSAASYLALRRRSRRGLLLLTILCLAWFGFLRGGCICSIGSVQNVALACGDSSYAIPAGVVAFFALPLIFTLFFGRTFCASVCPLGAVQEVVAVRSVRVPRWIDHSLGLLPHIYLGAAVIFAVSGTAFLICRYDPFVSFFRFSGNANIVVFSICILLISLVIGRPYCRYLCPYGAVLGWLSRVSKWHLRIPPSDCINCRLCEDACPYGAIHPPTPPQSPEQRERGKQRLGWLLLAAPGIIALLAWIGGWWSVPFSHLHPTVSLAEQVRREELGLTETTTDASDAFRSSDKPKEQLYAEALQLRQHFRHMAYWLGGWIGLVLSAKLIQLSVRRRRVDYHPEQSGCVSCGRCFQYCPVEQVRLGLINDVSEVVEEPNK